MFGTLVASIADLFDCTTQIDISRFAGKLGKTSIVSRSPQKYNTELERSVLSTVKEMAIDRIEYIETGTRSGILGEYFVRPQIVSLIQIYLLFNKLLDSFDYKLQA